MYLILDDHPLVQEGISAVIKSYRGEEAAVCARNVGDAICLTKANRVDMAFIDVNLSGETGFDYIEWLRESGISMRTFVITSSSLPGDFSRARKLGVDAYVLKDAFIDELFYGLRTVERGGKFYSAALIDQIDEKSLEDKRLGALTERELDVLTLLGSGYSNAKISQSLFISEGTVKKHISNILGKLRINSRVEAALFASSARITAD